MMIHKVQVNYHPGEHFVFIPKDSKILSFGIQRGDLVIWYAFELSNADNTEQITIFLAFTGSSFNTDLPYIGTVQGSDGLVWHAFG